MQYDRGKPSPGLCGRELTDMKQCSSCFVASHHPHRQTFGLMLSTYAVSIPSYLFHAQDAQDVMEHNAVVIGDTVCRRLLLYQSEGVPAQLLYNRRAESIAADWRLSSGTRFTSHACW